MSARLRLFVAIDAPPAAADLAGRVRRKLDAADLGIRWVATDALHITLRFLGDVSPDDVDAICAAMHSASRLIEPFLLEVADLGAFPSAARPHVIWLGVRQGATELATLHGVLTEMLEPLGFPRENRPWHPHVTIARWADRRHGEPPTLDRIVEVMRTSSAAAMARKIVLYASHSDRWGRRYARLCAAPLGSPPDR